MCLGAVDLIVWMKRRFPIETPPSLLFFAFCFTTCPDKHQYNDESKISPCSVFNQRGTKEAPFHYMTVINGCTALNELQADRGTRKCTQKASQTHTHTHHFELQRASFACRSMLFWSYDEVQHRNELLFQLLQLALNGHIYSRVSKITEFTSWRERHAITCNS